MSAGSPTHDYLLPQLTALVEGAVAEGFARDVVVAVLIDLITSTTFDTAAADPKVDASLDVPPWEINARGAAPE